MNDIAAPSTPPPRDRAATLDTPSSDEGWAEHDSVYGYTQTGFTPPPEGPKYPWPAEKFGMKYEDLFRKLAPRFNTYSDPLQCTLDFVDDVRRACEWASTPQELYDALAETRALNRQKLERGFDRAQEVFVERQLPSLTLGQYLAMTRLLQSRTLASVLDVVQASILADDGSGKCMRSVGRENVGTVWDGPLHPSPGRAETLPPSPHAAYSTDFTPRRYASPAVAKDSSLPDTLPAYMDSPERSPPGSPLEDTPPRDPPPVEHAGDETIDTGADPIPTTRTIPTCASPDAPASEDKPSSPASSKTASSNAAASPTTPPYVETVLEVPGCPIDTNGCPPAQPFILPPYPPSRKRRRVQDNEDDEAAFSPRQPKYAKI